MFAFNLKAKTFHYDFFFQNFRRHLKHLKSLRTSLLTSQFPMFISTKKKNTRFFSTYTTLYRIF